MSCGAWVWKVVSVSSELVVVGLSHRTAPVSVREQLAVREEELLDTLKEFSDGLAVQEAVLLSTCNRVELVAVTPEPHRLGERVTTVFNRKLAPDRVEEHLYRHLGIDAAAHLFRVAAGLDSLVVGEPQILGQVKTAFGLASDNGSVGTLLRRCFDRSEEHTSELQSQR